MKPEKPLQVLLEMRPALDGFAGIPQETRLLFRALCVLQSLRVQGLLQASLAFLSPGMSAGRNGAHAPGGEPVAEAMRIGRYGQVAMSLVAKPSGSRWAAIDLFVKRRREALLLALKTVLLPRDSVLKTSVFEPEGFESFVWQRLFAKTLLADDFATVTRQAFRVCTVPWNTLQSAGLKVLQWRKRAVYPTLDTRGIDVFVAQTPYPGRVSNGTALVVRYHDALPLFMPHAFANMARHHAAHWHALQSNVDSGAYFACVSEATRQDLLKVFPEVAERSVTIHNMLSPHYFDEPSKPSCVPGIIRARVNTQMPGASPAFRSLGEQEDFYRQHVGSGDDQPFKYLLMVSTIEPRKNHLCLLAAWQALRQANDLALKLVLVGSPGWDVEPIMREMRPFIDQGALFVLSSVPAADLRALYKHAQVTVCPSLAEGFDFSGVEAMCSGGVVLASDIAVHREVYVGAARYFAPYSAQCLQRSLEELLYGPQALALQNDLRCKALEVIPLYTQEALLPQWQALLDCSANGRMTSDLGTATWP